VFDELLVVKDNELLILGDDDDDDDDGDDDEKEMVVSNLLLLSSSNPCNIIILSIMNNIRVVKNMMIHVLQKGALQTLSNSSTRKIADHMEAVAVMGESVVVVCNELIAPNIPIVKHAFPNNTAKHRQDIMTANDFRQ
jgi:hypothetical protein